MSPAGHSLNSLHIALNLHRFGPMWLYVADGSGMCACMRMYACVGDALIMETMLDLCTRGQQTQMSHGK